MEKQKDKLKGMEGKADCCFCYYYSVFSMHLDILQSLLRVLHFLLRGEHENF